MKTIMKLKILIGTQVEIGDRKMHMRKWWYVVGREEVRDYTLHDE